MTVNPSGSAYPVPVQALLPKARKLVDRLGEIPSRNRLMREFGIGSPKATALREALQATRTPPTLHVVPDPPADPDPAPEPVGGSGDVPPETPADAVPPVVDASPLDSGDGHPVPAAHRPARPWPVVLLALPAFVAIWSGWVGLGALTGFGVVHPLPGIWDRFELNTAITLPVGVETYAAFALRVWLSTHLPATARRFAKWSAIGSLALGAAGQVAFHLMVAAGVTAAPWWITTLVACLPVAVLGMGAALVHLLRTPDPEGVSA